MKKNSLSTILDSMLKQSLIENVNLSRDASQQDEDHFIIEMPEEDMSSKNPHDHFAIDMNNLLENDQNESLLVRHSEANTGIIERIYNFASGFFSYFSQPEQESHEVYQPPIFTGDNVIEIFIPEQRQLKQNELMSCLKNDALNQLGIQALYAQYIEDPKLVTLSYTDIEEIFQRKLINANKILTQQEFQNLLQQTIIDQYIAIEKTKQEYAMLIAPYRDEKNFENIIEPLIISNIREACLSKAKDEQIQSQDALIHTQDRAIKRIRGNLNEQVKIKDVEILRLKNKLSTDAQQIAINNQNKEMAGLLKANKDLKIQLQEAQLRLINKITVDDVLVSFNKNIGNKESFAQSLIYNFDNPELVATTGMMYDGLYKLQATFKREITQDDLKWQGECIKSMKAFFTWIQNYNNKTERSSSHVEFVQQNTMNQSQIVHKQ